MIVTFINAISRKGRLRRGNCHCCAAQFTVSKRPETVAPFCNKPGAPWACQDNEDDCPHCSARSCLDLQMGQLLVEHHRCAICGCGTWPRAALGSDYPQHRIAGCGLGVVASIHAPQRSPPLWAKLIRWGEGGFRLRSGQLGYHRLPPAIRRLADQSFTSAWAEKHCPLIRVTECARGQFPYPQPLDHQVLYLAFAHLTRPRPSSPIAIFPIANAPMAIAPSAMRRRLLHQIRSHPHAARRAIAFQNSARRRVR
jgi:hypothetical protein